MKKLSARSYLQENVEKLLIQSLEIFNSFLIKELFSTPYIFKKLPYTANILFLIFYYLFNISFIYVKKKSTYQKIYLKCFHEIMIKITIHKSQ